MAFSDVVLLEIIKSIFWIIFFGVSVWIFHKEIRTLLQSLGSLKIAGSSFEFKDRNATIESYVLLTEALIDVLSRTEKIELVQQILVPSQVEKLSAFALRYTNEVSRQTWNEEMLRNIAYLLLRFGRYSQAVALYDELLKGRPNHVDLLNLKALALITSRLPDQIPKALPILSELVARYPEYHNIRFNLALAKSLSEDHNDAIKEMETVIKSPYLDQNNALLKDPLFHKTQEKEPASFKRLEGLANKEIQLRAQQKNSADAKNRAAD